MKDLDEQEQKRIVFVVGKFTGMILVTMDYRDHLLGKLADAFANGAIIHTPEHKIAPNTSVDFVSGPDGLVVVIENNEDVTDDFVKEAMACHVSHHHGKGNEKGEQNG